MRNFLTYLVDNMRCYALISVSVNAYFMHNLLQYIEL